MYYGYTMYDYGAHHLLMMLFGIIFLVFPVSRILTRTGFSPLWSVLAIVPGVNLVFLWVFALIDWPAGSKNTASSAMG